MTMKRLILLPLLATLCIAAPGETKTVLKLAWDYATNDTDVGTCIYVRTNLPTGMPLTNPMPATNAFIPTVTLPDRTNWVQCAAFAPGVTNCTLSMTNLPGWSTGYRGPYFFAATATNYVGESGFSNVVWSKPPPSSDKGFRGTLENP